MEIGNTAFMYKREGFLWYFYESFDTPTNWLNPVVKKVFYGFMLSRMITFYSYINFITDSKKEIITGIKR